MLTKEKKKMCYLKNEFPQINQIIKLALEWCKQIYSAVTFNYY